MKLLLDDRYAPLTSSVGFFEASVEDVVRVLHVYGPRILTPLLSWMIARREIHGSFPDVLYHLEPLSGLGSCRELVLATNSPWTAYFGNAAGQGGAISDVQGRMWGVCPALKCRGVSATCIPHTYRRQDGREQGRYGLVQFGLYGPERKRPSFNDIRVIAAEGGPGGEFIQGGEVQPFEHPERYTARKVADRFTAEMLEEYCMALGVRYFDPDFYGTDGVLVVDRISCATTARISLRDQQRRLVIIP